MAERTARDVITQAISDLDDIRDAIRGHRVDVPYPTKTSLYGELIANIRIGSVSGTQKHLAKTLLLQPTAREKTGIYAGLCTPIGSLTGHAEDLSDELTEV